jgi:hypothetical protein
LPVKNSLPLALANGIMNRKIIGFSQKAPARTVAEAKILVNRGPLALANGNERKNDLFDYVLTSQGKSKTLAKSLLQRGPMGLPFTHGWLYPSRNFIVKRIFFFYPLSGLPERGSTSVAKSG